MNIAEDSGFIVELEKRRLAAVLTNNPDELAPYLDDELSYIHSSAIRDGKAEYLEALRSGHLVYLAFRPENEAVRPLGSDGYLITGRMGIDIRIDGNPVSLSNLFTIVWRKGSDGQWRLLSWQSTPIPKK